MRSTRWFSLMLVIVSLLLPAMPIAGQDDGLIDDFEHGDFDDRWWFWTDNSSFTCSFESPGRESGRALRIAYDSGPEQWPGCGIGIETPKPWVSAEGLRFAWRSDTPGLDVEIVLNLADPAQTNPGADGFTPFEAYLTTPGPDWEEVLLPWDRFVKAEWVGESGTDHLDLSLLAELMVIVGAGQQGTFWIDDVWLFGGDSVAPEPATDKFTLWANGTQLRGINIWQRVVVPEIDGGEFLGSGHVGPPYSLQDFDQIAQMGANLVVISGPGLYTETPPYVLDEAVQANLDAILSLIAEADLFAVISFRTGPGRSDFTFYDEGIEEWGDPALVIDSVWTDQAAQDAWVEMWRYTAARYRDTPVVIGYDLMVEPNAAGRLLDIWDGSDFYPAYGNTLYDWNQFYPRIVDGIRSVDGDTPVLVGAMGWSAVRWLPHLRVIDDPRIVYTVHQYEPQDQYTHQYPDGEHTYPGQFDVDWDGVLDTFDRAWLDGFLSIIDDFQATYHVPVAVTEYGVIRWVPNAADFMRDEMELFEQRGLNHAFWAWNPDWPPANVENDDFDILHGPDPNNHARVTGSALIDVVLTDWSQNAIRPSSFKP